MEYFNVNSSNGYLIKGPFIIKPKIFFDDRGYFLKVGTSQNLIKLFLEKFISFKIITQNQNMVY